MSENEEEQPNPQKEEQPNLQKDLVEVFEKHGCSNYVVIADKNCFYNPGDIMEITKILKSAHANFYNQVMKLIGEA